MQELTIEELKEKIKMQFDEVQLLDSLNITMDELVETFSDLIESKYDYFLKELND